MTRFKAAAIHLSLSALVGLALLAAFWFVWYPAPLFTAVGGLEIFVAVVTVDVLLGPLLTLVVYNEKKKSLKFDLAVIAAVQLAALAYGVLTLWDGRPVYVAALGFRFDVIQAAEVDAEELRNSGKKLPIWGPTFVGTKPAADTEEKTRVMFLAVAGVDYGHLPRYHVPLAEMRDKILKDIKPISELRTHNPGRDAEIAQWLRARNRPDESSVGYQGLKARAQPMAVILDAKTAEVIGIAPFKPWD